MTQVCVTHCFEAHDLLFEAGSLVEDSLVGDFGLVGGLDLGLDANELLLEGVLGSTVQHFGLDVGNVGRPLDEANLAALTTLRGELEVEDSETAVLLGEDLQEVVIGGGLGAGRLEGEGSLVVRDLVQQITEAVLELEFVELRDTVVRDGNSAGL